MQDIADQGEADEFGSATDERIHAHGRCGKSGIEINLMEFEAELHAGSGGEKCLADEGNGPIERRSGRKRAAVSDIEFLEDREAAGTNVTLEFVKRNDRIGIIHEDETANNGVEWFVERHFGRVAFEETNVAHTAELCAGDGPLNRRSSAVGADDLTAGTDEIRNQECDIASAAADIENTHAGCDASLEKELASEGLESLRLAAESMEFLLGVAESVRGTLCGGGAHGSLENELSSLGKNDCNRKKGKKVKETERDFGYAAQGGWNEICEGGVLGSGNLGIAGNHATVLYV